MNADMLLRKLGELENALAELYEWYSDCLEPDAEAVYVFIKMSREERGHARLVDYHSRLARKDAKLLAGLDLDEKALDAVLARVWALRRAPGKPTLAEAVRAAISLEASAAEGLYRGSLREVNPEVAKLLLTLGGEDRAHVERLRDMARHRAIPIPEEANGPT